jgi:hypothetical protein
MELFKLNKGCIGCCLLLLLKFTDSKAQEAINNVAIEKISTTSFKVRYKLNAVTDQKYQSVSLKTGEEKVLSKRFFQAILPLLQN